MFQLKVKLIQKNKDYKNHVLLELYLDKKKKKKKNK